jgi:hypothetical protein
MSRRDTFDADVSERAEAWSPSGQDVSGTPRRAEHGGATKGAADVSQPSPPAVDASEPSAAAERAAAPGTASPPLRTPNEIVATEAEGRSARRGTPS